MFWGLTIEPGKHYSQTVDQSFHVSMAALDTREKSGITQLLVRHEKAEFLLCTLQYGDDHPFPCFQQQLNLNLAEGSEISFYSEGKGTIHLTGYLVTDEPLATDPSLLAEAESLLMGEEEEDEDEIYDSDEEEEDYSDSDMESASSADLSWKQMILDVDEEDEDDSEEEEWTPQSAKKASAKKTLKKKKRKSDDSSSDQVSPTCLKMKRKAAVESETLSKNEMAAEGEGEEEEEDGDFIPADEFDDEEDEEEYDDDVDEGDDDDEDFDEEEEDEPKTPSKQKSPAAKQKTEKKASTPSKVKKELSEVEKESPETPKSESPLKKKKKKKQQKANQDGGEEDGGEGEMPLKNLKADNKENIDAQQKEKTAKKEREKTKPPATPKKIKLKSGTVIEDLKVGAGKLAKHGKKVFMYYRGVLANNQKEFDSILSGKPFIFNLGRGEVIKAWDEGVTGMKVGGKRKLTVPPSQGYGSQRMGPIPPNSTLVFEVELKQVR